MKNLLEPNRSAFSDDPFGYSALAWHKWSVAQVLAGFSGDPTKAPRSVDLKDPVLWMSHAAALSEAATVLLKTEPGWERMPVLARGMCDGQFCGVALMLIGYSLEACLKGMHIHRKGADAYASQERQFHHHRLEELVDLISDLDAREKVVLRLLTHFTTWAGRYPDPGTKFEASLEEVFKLSEEHKIAAHDLFALVSKVMQRAVASTSHGERRMP